MSKRKTRRVVFAGAGTAGHVEPALAVARWLRNEDAGIEITFLGTSSGVENSLVPAAGFDLALIQKAAFPRSIGVEALLWPARFIQSFTQVQKIARGSSLVIGFGGYVCAPAYLAAKLSGVEIFAHEANAKPGMANAFGVKLGATPLMAFESVDKKFEKGLVVGIPLRSQITHLARLTPVERTKARAAALQKFGLDPANKTLLVFGGSLGSAKFNAAIDGSLDALLGAGIQVIHAVGGKNTLPPARPGYLPLNYITEMDQAYAAADCVISRSGAVSVSETGVLGIYAIYVPLDIGNGEQRYNAQIVVNRGGGEIISNSEFSAELIMSSVTAWFERAQRYRESNSVMDFPLDGAMRIGVKVLSALRIAEKRGGGRRG